MISEERHIKEYCKDFKNIENYDKAVKDTTQVWHCHHRLETNFSNGNLRPKKAQLTYKELKALGVYYNRPAEELIFLTKEEHEKIHNITGIKCKSHTKEYTNEYNKMRLKTPKHKRYMKIQTWARNHNYPKPSTVDFPKGWCDEDKNEYTRQYNNKKGVKVGC